jgi:hypothetical protein
VVSAAASEKDKPLDEESGHSIEQDQDPEALVISAKIEW